MTSAMFGALYFAAAYLGQAFPAPGPVVIPVVAIVRARARSLGSPLVL